jgi:hypothetical protein
MDKKQIAKNILARADSVLYFLDHALNFANMKANDIAWQRSILIMISYAFELILKAELVFTSEKISADEIDNELRGFGHNIQQIIDEIKKRSSLSLMGVSNYTVTKKDILKQYVITFKDNTEVIVEDFVDIRYDYTKNTLREIIDHEIITMYIKKILELSKNVSSREGSK